MGLFGIKKQLLSVIEWEDSTKDTLVYRYEHPKREEIMNSSTLVVRPSQVAMFVHKGEICDVFKPGTYKLLTENVPIITKLLSLPTGFNSPIKAEVYYVNTKQITGNKWGTQNPIMMRDSEFGNIRVRAFGVYSFKVKDAKKFMEELFGTNSTYTASDVAGQITPMIISALSNVIGKENVNALDMAKNYHDFEDKVIEQCQEDFEKFGLELKTLVIENISLPEEVEKILDERTKVGVMSDKMGTYTQMQAAQALRDVANNPGSGGLAGLGVGVGAGMGLGSMLGETLAGAKDKPKMEVPKDKAGNVKICPKCNAENKASAKFCSECGEKFAEEKFCSACGTKVKANAKFCPECGEKL